MIYRCRCLLDKLTNTPIMVEINNKTYMLYYRNGDLTNKGANEQWVQQ